jgi:hypothetical protein
MTSLFLYKERQKASKAEGFVTDNSSLLEKAQLPTIIDNGNYIKEPHLSITVTIKLTLIFKNSFS